MSIKLGVLYEKKLFSSTLILELKIKAPHANGPSVMHLQTRRRLPYLIGFIILIGLLIYLLTNPFRSALQYYVTVSELYAAESKYHDKTLKVAGHAKGIVRHEEAVGARYEFDVEEGGKTLHVTYRGFVPDTFKENSEVVVTGHVMADGSFEAEQLLAKCASKYEAKIK